MNSLLPCEIAYLQIGGLGHGHLSVGRHYSAYHTVAAWKKIAQLSGATGAKGRQVDLTDEML